MPTYFRGKLQYYCLISISYITYITLFLGNFSLDRFLQQTLPMADIATLIARDIHEPKACDYYVAGSQALGKA